DVTTGALAVAAGACVIEKHLSYDRHAQGPDHAASLDPQGFDQYVQLIRQATQMVGVAHKRVQDIESDVRRVARQSGCATCDLEAGDVLKAKELTVKRPGTGVPASELTKLVGRKLVRDVKATP